MTAVLSDILVALASILCMLVLSLWVVLPRSQEWLT